MIAWVALAAYLLLAIGTYSVGDPGWSSTGNGAGISNSAGSTGAWIADVLLSLFGYVSYLFPVLLGFRAWALVRDRQSPFVFDWLLVSIRSVGFVLVVLAGTGLLAIKGSATTLLPFGIGGMLGETLAQVCQRAFGLPGSQLLLVALLLFGVTIFTDLSWARLLETTGRLTLTALGRVAPLAGTALARLPRREPASEQDGRSGSGPGTPASARELTADELDEGNARKRRARREPVLDDAPMDLPAAPGARVTPGIGNAPQVRTTPEIRLPEKRKEAQGERLQREKQGALFNAAAGTTLPPLGLLDMADKSKQRGFSAEALEAMSRLLEIKLRDFGVEAKVVSVLPGPVITRFEIQPAPGVKVSRISNLVKDLARSLAVISVRVVEVIPGKSVVGIEIPNEDRETVLLGDVLASRAYEASKSPLTLALGNDISGEPMVVDLARMPHLLVAGTTGSGKSVGVNAMLLSLLYKSTPADVRLIMVDPKMLELSVYEGIPHLLTPVVTDMKDAANGLRWCVAEMERRYKLMAALGVRNLAGFNRKVLDAMEAGRADRGPVLDARPHGVHHRGGAARHAADAGAAARDRGRDRRIRRHDDDRRQEGRGADRAHRAEGARRRHPPDPRDPAPLGRRDHRPDQGQHPDAHGLPGVLEDRFAHHPRPGRRRAAARATATCSTCRPAAACRSACTAPSSPTPRCTAWSRTCARARAPTTSRASSRRAPPRRWRCFRARPATIPRATASTTRRCAS